MTSDELTVIAGAVLSLAFSYVPGLRNRYEPLRDEIKRLIMLALLATVTAGFYALACTPWGTWLDTGVECGKPGLARLVWALALAVMTNQATFVVTSKVKRET